jgi:hypothetical protein
MSSFGALKLLTVVLLSAAVSVGSTVAIVRYVPDVVAMPVPDSDVYVKTYAAPVDLVCTGQTDWVNAEGLSTSFYVRQDGSALILLSYRYSYMYLSNNPDARAFVYLKATVDGVSLNDDPVCASYMDESADMGGTLVFHASGLKQGTHTLAFTWRNTGQADGHLQEAVIDVVMFPARNVS